MKNGAYLGRVLSRKGAVFLIAAIVCGIIAAWGGPTLSIDSHGYVALADAIRGGDVGVYATTHSATWTVVVVPVLIAVSKALAAGHWPELFVFFNVLVCAAAATCLVAAIRDLADSAIAAAVGLCFFIGAFDVVTWVRYVLTDIVFVCFATATFAVAIRGIARNESPVRRRALLGTLLVLCFTTRPVGVILVPIVVMTELLTIRVHGAKQIGAARRVAPWAVVVLVTITVPLVRAYLFHDMTRWPTDFMRPKLEQYAARERTGEVVWDRPEIAHSPPSSPSDHVVIEVARFLRFFQFTSATFSRAHNLVNVVYYIPLYLLGLLGAIRGMRDGDARVQAMVTAALLWILGLAWFHGVTILDFDWRYRVPALPQLAFLAAYGADALFQKVAGRRQLIAASRLV